MTFVELNFRTGKYLTFLFRWAYLYDTQMQKLLLIELRFEPKINTTLLVRIYNTVGDYSWNYPHP